MLVHCELLLLVWFGLVIFWGEMGVGSRNCIIFMLESNSMENYFLLINQAPMFLQTFSQVLYPVSPPFFVFVFKVFFPFL